MIAKTVVTVSLLLSVQAGLSAEAGEATRPREVQVTDAIQTANRDLNRQLAAFAPAGLSRIDVGSSMADTAHHLDTLARATALDTSNRVKLNALRALAQRASTLANSSSVSEDLAPFGFVLPEAAGDSPVALADGAIGTSCELAFSADIGDRAQFRLGAGQSVWIRVKGSASSAVITTRGSEVDTRLSAWGACDRVHEAPLFSADDSFGLQSDLPLPERDEFRWFKLENLGGEGVTSVSVVRSFRITGSYAFATGVVRQDYWSLHALERLPNGQGAFVASAVLGENSYSIDTPSSVPIYVKTTEYLDVTPYNARPEAWPNVGCGSPDSLALETCLVGSPQAINPVEGGSRAGIDFLIDKGGLISGLVSGDAGTLLKGIDVTVYDRNGVYLGRAITDASGRYRLGFVPDGDYILAAGATNYRRELWQEIPCEPDCAILSGTRLPVTGGQSHSANFQLQRRPFVRATVTVDPLVGPPDSVTLSALNGSGAVVATSRPFGSNEPFELGPLPSGSYRIKVSASRSYSALSGGVRCASDCVAEFAQGVPVTLRDDGSATELSFQLDRFPLIEGQVIDASNGQPIADTVVAIYLQRFALQFYTATTDAQGRYRYVVGEMGNVLVVGRSPRHVDLANGGVPCELPVPLTECPGATLTSITPGGPDVTVNFSLTPSVAITGLVRRSSVDDYLPNFRAFQLRPNSNADPLTRAVTLLPNERYLATDLMPGNWRLGFEHRFDYPQVVPLIDCGATWSTDPFGLCAGTQGQVFNLHPGENLTDINFFIRGNYTWRGRVIDEISGQPLAGIPIDVWNAQGWLAQSVVSGPEGYFFVGSLGSPPSLVVSTDARGPYRNEVFDNRQCAVGSVYLGTCSIQGATMLQKRADTSMDGDVLFALFSDTGFADGFE